MEYMGIKANIKNKPVFDEDFYPLKKFFDEYLKGAKKPVVIALYRNQGYVSVYNTFIYGTADKEELDSYYIQRLVKLLLYTKGGYKVVICGDNRVTSYVKRIFSKTGKRAFDNELMERVYDNYFEIVYIPANSAPSENESSSAVNIDKNGNRIGMEINQEFISAVALCNGGLVFSGKEKWEPQANSKPEYHCKFIADMIQKAASKLEKVDCIGVSSAGIHIDNKTMISSLYSLVSDRDFEKKIKNIYIDIASDLETRLRVENDGDVTALAGAQIIDSGNVLGIILGASEGSGYVDKNRNITGWLNELAFAPVACSDSAVFDSWSGDYGCGGQYLSDSAVARLAYKAGFSFEKSLNDTQKREQLQKALQENDQKAIKVFSDIGIYLGHIIPLYAQIYEISHIMLLGEIMASKSGEIIIESAKKVLCEEYPECCNIVLHLPEETVIKEGLSFAAASLN